MIANCYIIFMFIIITVILIICNYNKSSNNNNKRANRSGPNLKDDISNLQIIFLKMTKCVFCIRQEQFLKDQNLLESFKIIDIENDEGRNIAKQYSVTGFPTFISEKTGKKTSGFTTSMPQLIENLS